MVLDPMTKKEITATIRTISRRSVPGGGFSEQPGAPFRVDATAWAILALKAMGTHSNLVDIGEIEACFRTAQDDGRVCLAQDQPQIFWPTALAIMAWNGSVAYVDSQELAIQFLLTTEGEIHKDEIIPIFTHRYILIRDGPGSRIPSPGLNRRPCPSSLLSLVDTARMTVFRKG